MFSKFEKGAMQGPFGEIGGHGDLFLTLKILQVKSVSSKPYPCEPKIV